MTLQPLDIKRQTFARAFRGYEPAEVDAFLKQVADQQAAIQESLRQAEDRVRDAEGKLKHYERVEMALQEALETARETGRRAEESAERQGRVIVDRAEARAEEILRDAERDRYALRQDVMKLSTRQAEVAARLRGFLLSELEILAQFQGDDPVGFLKLQPAGGAHALPPAPRAALSEGALTPLDPPSSLDAPADASASPPADEPPDAPADASSASSAAGASAAAPPATESGPPERPTTAPPAETPRPETPRPEAPASETPSSEVPASDPLSPPAWRQPAWTDAPPSPPDSTAPAAPAPPAEAASPGWDLRSLVTGVEDASAAGSEAERERIRRILDDLD